MLVANRLGIKLQKPRVFFQSNDLGNRERRETEEGGKRNA